MMSLVAPAPARLHANASTSLRPQQRNTLRVVAGDKRSRVDHDAPSMASFKQSPNDCGSTQMQIALLSSRVGNLTAHLKENKKDYSTQRGLLKVG